MVSIGMVGMLTLIVSATCASPWNLFLKSMTPLDLVSFKVDDGNHIRLGDAWRECCFLSSFAKFLDIMF